MTPRSKQFLFFAAYVYVLFQLFAMFLTTLAVIQLGAPSAVKSAAMFASCFLGVVTLIVMILRPTLEREMSHEGGREVLRGHGFSRADQQNNTSGL